MKSSGSHAVFLNWFLLASVSAFGVYVSWDQGLLQKILSQDQTRICLVILLGALIGSLLAGWRSWYLSQQTAFFSLIKSTIAARGWGAIQTELSHLADRSVCFDYLKHQDPQVHPSQSQLLAEVMAEKVRGSNQVGWFVTGLMIKLGLLGTVVGFILMLSTVEGLSTLDIKDIKNLMQQMTQGMGIAMNTTLVGLIASMLLGLQYLFIDRMADRLVSDTVMFAHQHNPVSRVG